MWRARNLPRRQPLPEIREPENVVARQDGVVHRRQQGGKQELWEWRAADIPGQIASAHGTKLDVQHL
jgi:hypothetical protein